MKNSPWMMYFGFFLIMPFLTWAGVSTYGESKKTEAFSHLKAAAFAPSVENAHEELSLAIKEMEKNGWTEGHTSAFWKSEDENVGTWFKRIVAMRDSMSDGQEVVYDQEIGLEPTAMVSKSVHLSLTSSAIVLQNVRTTLTAPDGTVRSPDGLARFPNNIGMAWLLGLGFPAFIAGMVMLVWKFI